jgi:hypothetical protein
LIDIPCPSQVLNTHYIAPHRLLVAAGLPLTWQLPCFVAIFTILRGAVAKKPRKFGAILEQKRGKIEKNMAISWLDSKRGRFAMF